MPERNFPSSGSTTVPSGSRRGHAPVEVSDLDVNMRPPLTLVEEVDPEPRNVCRVLVSDADATPLICPHSPLAMAPVTIHSPRPKTEAEKRGTVFSSILNLTATTMGVGMLSLPHAFALTGVIPGVVLILCSALLADCSLRWLVTISRASERYSFEGNADFFYGRRGRIALNVVLVALLFGASVSVFEVFTTLISSTIKNLAGCERDQCDTVFLKAPFVGFVSIVAVGYFLVQDSMHKLRHMSFVALGGLAYYFIVLLTLFTTRASPMIHPSVKLVGTASDCLTALPVMFSAYICQFNIFKVDAELRADSRKHVNTVIHATIFGIATSAYVFGGLMGYCMKGADVSSNILEDMSYLSTTIAGGALAMTNLSKLPLVFIPLRQSIQLGLGTEKYSYLISLILIVLVYITALLLGSLTKALAITGITAGCAISFVFPGAMYYCYLTRFAMDRPPNLLQPVEAEGGLGSFDLDAVPVEPMGRSNTKLQRIASGGVAWFGAVISVVGLINIAVNWDKV